MSEERKPSEMLAVLTAEFFEVQARIAQDSARARVILSLASETAARAEVEAQRRVAPNFYTEDEAAARMQISRDSLQRLRKAHNLPHTRLGALVRYTDEQLREVARVLERPRRQRPAAVKSQAAA